MLCFCRCYRDVRKITAPIPLDVIHGRCGGKWIGTVLSTKRFSNVVNVMLNIHPNSVKKLDCYIRWKILAETKCIESLPEPILRLKRSNIWETNWPSIVRLPSYVARHPIGIFANKLFCLHPLVHKSLTRKREEKLHHPLKNTVNELILLRGSREKLQKINVCRAGFHNPGRCMYMYYRDW